MQLSRELFLSYYIILLQACIVLNINLETV